MKKFFLATAALVLGLTFAGAASAHETRVIVVPSRPRVYVGTSYQIDYGVRFSGGYYYRGYDHHHWSSRVWDAHYGRYHYYDPYVRIYYYWAPERGCYYPVGW